MARLIIDSENRGDLDLIRKLALRLKARIRVEGEKESISIIKEKEPTKLGFLEAMEKAVESGGVKSIEDPAVWQKKIRS